MKTAEELISDITKWDGALHRETVIEIAKHVQKEAIEETVRRCVQESTMDYTITRNGRISSDKGKIIEYEIKKELGL